MKEFKSFIFNYNGKEIELFSREEFNEYIYEEETCIYIEIEGEKKFLTSSSFGFPKEDIKEELNKIFNS